MRVAIALTCLLAASCQEPSQSDLAEEEFGLTKDEVVSGYTMLTAETQAMQDDEFLNPGYLWVDQGEALFRRSEGADSSCSTCHQDGLVGVAAQYPKIDADTGQLFNLEARINHCRNKHQELDSLDYESQDLIALTAYIAHQSKGMPVDVEVGAAERPYYDKGRDYFFTRRGQFNLSCHQCHDETWGKRLRGDMISQGHATGFPTYRLEWQALGSSHRRLRDCDHGVRAEPLEFGDETYIAVELYLAARAQGLELEAPAVRR